MSGLLKPNVSEETSYLVEVWDLLKFYILYILSQQLGILALVKKMK